MRRTETLLSSLGSRPYRLGDIPTLFHCPTIEPGGAWPRPRREMLPVFLHSAGELFGEFAEVAVLGFSMAGILNAVVSKPAATRHLRGGTVSANALAATLGLLTPSVAARSTDGPHNLSVRQPSRACLCVPDSGPMVQLVRPHRPGRFPWIEGRRRGLSVGGHSGVHCGRAHRHARGSAPRGSAVLPLEPVGGRNQAGCCDTGVGNRARLTLLDFSDPREKARLGARFAIDLLRELGPWMIGGILLAGAIEARNPEGTNYTIPPESKSDGTPGGTPHRRGALHRQPRLIAVGANIARPEARCGGAGWFCWWRAWGRTSPR